MTLAEYFKSKKEFTKMMNLLKDKYIKLNRFSGTINITNITIEEAKVYSDFFGTTIMPNSTYKTSFAKIEKVINNTKYDGFTWEEVFLEYFGEISTNKEISERENDAQNNIINNIIGLLDKDMQDFFLSIWYGKSQLKSLLLAKYHKNKNDFENDIKWILTIIQDLDKLTPTTLTMLSSVSSNPHFLDLNTSNGNLFIKLLASYKKVDEPLSTESKILFLENFAIYIDSLSNNAITYGLISDKAWINECTNSCEPIILSLKNLENVKYLDTNLKKVFVFENPSMGLFFADKNIPIIITSGMPNSVVYKILELLVKSDNAIYYNGDFDPEGLIIAQKLKERIPGIKFICYHSKDYLECKSTKKISSKSLSKLNGIKCEELKEIKQILNEQKMAGYQEKNVANINNAIESIVL